MWKILNYLEIKKNKVSEKAFVKQEFEDGCGLDDIDNVLNISKKIY